MRARTFVLLRLRLLFSEMKILGKRMPRPGRKVPPRLAPNERVDAHPELRDQFIVRILGFRPGSRVSITGESTLGDFGDEGRVAEFARRIRDVYGVDVSDPKEGKLGDILDRIAAARADPAWTLLDGAEYLYLRHIREPRDNALGVVVEEAVTAWGGPPPRIGSSAGLGELFSQAGPIVSDDGCFCYELTWKSYVAYAVRNESFATADKEEPHEGRLLRRYASGKLREFVAKSTFSESLFADRIGYWQIVTLNHVVDVAAVEAPQIRRFRAKKVRMASLPLPFGRKRIFFRWFRGRRIAMAPPPKRPLRLRLAALGLYLAALGCAGLAATRGGFDVPAFCFAVGAAGLLAWSLRTAFRRSGTVVWWKG